METPTEKGYCAGCGRSVDDVLFNGHADDCTRGEAHPTPSPAALAPERDVWQVAFGAIREMQRSGESAEMCARWIAERLAAPLPARAEAPEGEPE
jgi:hypothetical protein